MNPVNWQHVWFFVRTYVLNKYVIAVLLFVGIYIFVGEQSILKSISRARQIRETEQELEITEQRIDEATRMLNSLEQTDTLEKYAREHYLMHRDDEDVFLVDEQ